MPGHPASPLPQPSDQKIPIQPDVPETFRPKNVVKFDLLKPQPGPVPPLSCELAGSPQGMLPNCSCCSTEWIWVSNPGTGSLKRERNRAPRWKMGGRSCHFPKACGWTVVGCPGFPVPVPQTELGDSMLTFQLKSLHCSN